MRKLAIALAILASTVAEGRARLLLSQGEALGLAFPAGAAIEKKTAFLSEEQAARIEALARTKIESRVWTYYAGAGADGSRNCAYFDRTIIRTLPAVVMGVVGPDGELKLLEVLSFNEPSDYLPRKRWLTLFGERPLDDELRVGAAIRNVSGSTLTTRALTDSARRILALHAVLHEAPGK